MDGDKKPAPPVRPGSCAATATQPPTYRSEELFSGAKVVVIVHDGREYQLRITHAKKLILTA